MKRLAGIFLALAVIPLLISMANAADGFRLLTLHGRDVKWGRPKSGTGASLSYAVVTAPVASVVNCRAVTAVDDLLARSALSRLVFDQELSAAFGFWQSAANLRFTPAKTVAGADIVIGAEAVADGVGYADVASEPLPGQAFDRITKGIVCLNPDLHWTAQNAGYGSNEQKSYRLRIVLAHEIGHVLGLDHPSPHGALMSFDYDNALNGLQQGDNAGIVELYGAAPRHVVAGGIALNALAR